MRKSEISDTISNLQEQVQFSKAELRDLKQELFQARILSQDGYTTRNINNAISISDLKETLDLLLDHFNLEKVPEHTKIIAKEGGDR